METGAGTTVPFPYKPYITAMLIEYKNPDGSLIAEKVLPYIKVESKTYSYNKFPAGTNFSIPDEMEVGRVSKTPEVYFKATQEPAELVTYAVQSPIPRLDNELTPAAFDVTSKTVARLLNIHDLQHEVEVSDLLRNPNTYPAENQMAFAPGSRWSDPATDPFTLIEKTLVNAFVPFNKLVLGADVWFELSKHPKVIQAILGNANTAGRVTKEEFAYKLGLDEVIVGRARVDVSAPGPDKQPVFKRCWEKDAILLKVDPLSTTMQDFTFGLTAELKSGRQVLHHVETNQGAKYSDVYRVVHSRKPHIMANKLGFLFKGCVE